MKKKNLRYSKSTPLPNSFIIEQSILNILLNNPTLIKSILSVLPDKSFSFQEHRFLYKALIELAETNLTISTTLLITHLQDKNLLEEIGGIKKIVSIMNRWEDTLSLDTYIAIVNEKYIRRLIIEIGKQIIGWGYVTSITVDNILEKIENSLYNLGQEKKAKKTYTAAEIMDDIFEEMNQKITRKESSGLYSSYSNLDSIIQGFQASDLIIIAGRPSMGKTAFSLNLGFNIVERYNIPLVIFTLEMSRQQIIYRFLSSTTDITSTRLKSGKMTEPEWIALGKGMRRISDLPIYIDDNSAISLRDIRTKITNIFNDTKKSGIVIIDYLQLMKVNENMENRVQEISHITRDLKMMAKEFNIPIIVLSQLSRSLESRTNKRPMLSDLRESGCISNPIISSEFQSWTKTSLISISKIRFEFKGLKPTYKIQFEKGVTITLTSNHRILCKQGWIKFSEINLNTKFFFLVKRKEKKVRSFYKKIKNIVYQGLEPVYDKKIPTFHNYLVKNFIVHNSIEQDADVVIMLYREDYYKGEGEEFQETELIISKHRNGPLGTARLLFNPKYTKFFDDK